MWKKHTVILVTLCLSGVSALASNTPAIPFPGDVIPTLQSKSADGLITTFGDPEDFMAATQAGADYLVQMQADITEDNAGNGFTDPDPEDGGWDWSSMIFEHSAAASPTNIYGATAQGLHRAYLASGAASYFTAMTDAADFIVASGPDDPGGIRSASDVVFLLNYASLPAVAVPATYQNAAVTIWDRHLTVYGSATAFAELIRDARAGQGYPNGIIPWDIGAWALALSMMDAVLPGNGYDTDADDIAEVIWQDSFNGAPGYFDPDGHSQGAVDDYSNTDYYWYPLGITGLIDAFVAADVHTGEIAGLQILLLDCQYEDGAFSYQYGADPTFDDRDWQAASYAAITMGARLTGLEKEINRAAWWIAATQDVSGGFVYGSGNHYPEIGGENTAGMSYGSFMVLQEATDLLISAEDCPDQTPAHDPCREETTFTYSISTSGQGDAWRAVTVRFQYEPAYLVLNSITQIYDHATDFTHFDYYDMGSGEYEVTLAISGLTDGESAAQDLFSVEFDGFAEPAAPDYSTPVTITAVIVRDLFNQPLDASSGWDDLVQVDDTVPVAIPDDFWAPGSEPCVTVDITFPLETEDNILLDRVEYELNSSGSWLTVIDNIDAATWSDSWTLDVTALPDGMNTIKFRVWDAVGYLSAITTYQFFKDNTPPVAVTDLDATPEHVEVNLSWSVPAGHIGAGDGYELYRALRPTYPYEGGLTGESSWDGDYTLIATLTNSSQTTYQDLAFTDNSDLYRGVYDYKLVAYDCVNGDVAGNTASATNYFLGDWAANDGIVFSGDLAMLSISYGTSGGDPTWDAELDIAPTSDYSSYGLPGPDDRINFEDLIIFAMNYDIGGPPIPISSWDDFIGKTPIVDMDLSALLVEDEGSVRFMLTGVVKGVSARIRTERNLVNATSTSGPLFSYREDGVWHLDLVALQGNLENPVILLDFAGEGSLELIGVDARDQYNQLLMTTLEESSSSELPTSYTLSQNYPNPFNPATTIGYALPEAVQVRLTVYNTVGQQVATVVNNLQQPGVYSVTLDGSRWASGVYYYRLEAGSFTELRKMVLLK